MMKKRAYKGGIRSKGICGIIHMFCLLTAAAAILSLSGCKGDDSRNSDLGIEDNVEKAADVEKKKLEADSVVISVGKEVATYRELLVYMYILKDKYQDTLGDDIWEYKLDTGKSFRQTTMSQVVSLITQLKITGREAKSLGINLTSDETEDIRQYVQGLYSEIAREDIEEFMLDVDTMTDVYCENEIANRVYDSFINGVSTSISDDDSRQCKVWYIYLQTSGVNQSGVKVTLSDKEIKKRLKEAKKLRKNALSTRDFLSFATAHTESESAELTFGKGDMCREFEDVAFQLKEGEISEVVTSPEGFYIIYCVDANDEELAAARKEEIIAGEQKEHFEKQYSEWAAGFQVEVSDLIL